MAIIGGWKLKYKKRRKPRKTRAEAVKFKAYTKRNDRLSELGYDGYAEYLESDDWKKIRERKLQKFPNCLLCQKPAKQVHHLDYSHEVLLGLVPQLLVTLCEGCHEAIEFTPEKEKRNLSEANRHLRALAHAAGHQRWLASVKHAHDEMVRRRKQTWKENVRRKSKEHHDIVNAVRKWKAARDAAKAAGLPAPPKPKFQKPR